eukprot:TRINITY_DN5697_c0_g2_i1.p1 TRINITY_DN5697_c0_g2~~TRINITY_DN5697_c0_g2_i1.p1  ORF type:complete len:755 (+),score=330.95 TRINITY_DN5697_c0_g2_i1:163-2265(+)
MLSELPALDPMGKWELPEEECKKRRDLRNTRIFSIDPLGSQDVDDALGVTKLPNGNIQVGVHIADVTYFIQPGSPLDTEAALRSTTVYLSDRKFDMFPGRLSENVASLREGVDRPALSVIWEFNLKLEVENVWFGRTAIRNYGEIYYEFAQRVCDNKCTPEEMKKLGKDFPQVREEIQILMKIARKLRENRIAAGAVELESTEIRFKFDDKGSKLPTTLIPKRSQEINKTVAEWMIFANKAVAERIFRNYPTCALLRHHVLPRAHRFENLIKMAASRGFNMNVSSNKDLSESLDQAVVPKDPTFNLMLRTMATLAMEEAEYISTGSYSQEEFYHYGLAAKFYTHFTSPIRRYADVLVHRQLLGAISQPVQDPIMTDGQMTDMCQHINRRHRQSKNAQRDSTELFECLYFRNFPEISEGIIYEFRNNGFQVFLPKFGIQGTVWLRSSTGELQIPENAMSLNPERYTSGIKIRNFRINEENSKLILETEKGEISVELFDHVMIKLNVQESRAHRPQLKMELVNFGSSQSSQENSTSTSTSTSNLKIPSKNEIHREMEEAILKQEEIKASLESRVPENFRPDYKTYAQSGSNLYLLFENFSQLEIPAGISDEISTSTSTSTSTSSHDKTVRYWKLKKRPKQKMIQVEDDGGFREFEMTDEEREMIRLEAEERRRSKMTLEQKYSGQISQLETKMRGMMMRNKK